MGSHLKIEYCEDNQRSSFVAFDSKDIWVDKVHMRATQQDLSFLQEVISKVLESYAAYTAFYDEFSKALSEEKVTREKDKLEKRREIDQQWDCSAIVGPLVSQ